MMRNPERIDFVLRELEKLWKELPDWRLGQFIFNIVGRDPFFIEDYELIEEGYRKFGQNTFLINDDFPEYWVDPNIFKELINNLNGNMKNEI